MWPMPFYAIGNSGIAIDKAVFNKSKIVQGEGKTNKFTCVFCRAAAYLLERYKFESESQHIHVTAYKIVRLYLISQR